MTEPPPKSWYKPHAPAPPPARAHAKEDYPVYVTTFRHPDGGFSPHYLEAKARIERLGFLVVPVVGGDVAFWSARMKTRVHESGICFLHVRELVLPLVDAARPGFLVAEDDACFHESFTFDAFAALLEAHPGAPLWLGYQKAGPGYCMGTQLLYFPAAALPRLTDAMARTSPRHIDLFYRKVLDVPRLPNMTTDRSPYCGEFEHFTVISGHQVRPGVAVGRLPLPPAHVSAAQQAVAPTAAPPPPSQQQAAPLKAAPPPPRATAPPPPRATAPPPAPPPAATAKPRGTSSFREFVESRKRAAKARA